jgi:hypothetical protein
MHSICRLLIFSHSRAKRGVEAARVLFVEGGSEHVMWMGIDELKHVLAAHGPDKELQRALALYGMYSKNQYDCESPALYQRTPEYPYGDRVPRHIRMRRTVTTPVQLGGTWGMLMARLPPVAIIGTRVKAWTNVDGTVSAMFADGDKLALNAEDFHVLDWDAVVSNADDLA